MGEKASVKPRNRAEKPTTALLIFLVVCAVMVFVALPISVHAQLENPATACTDIKQCIEKFIEYALGLAGVLALAGIVYGGFVYITAAGNQERVESGKNAVTYSIIGLVVIGLAFAIVNFVFQALGGGGGAGGVGN